MRVGDLPVPTAAETFREIHRLRRHAKDLQADIERGPRQLQLQKKKITLAEDGLKQAQEEITRLKLANRERETTVKATNTLVEKHQRQLNEATSRKEYDALKTEIASEQGKVQKLEDEILQAMMTIDEKAAQLPEFENTIKQAKADFAAFESTNEIRLGERKQMLETTLQQLKEVEANLSEDVRPQYQRLVASMGADAMARVEGISCTTCYVGLTAQNMNELRMGMLVVCKSCGRFLYLPE